MENAVKTDIRIYGDPVLRRRAEPVAEIDDQVLSLLHTMARAMYEAQGVGLAAPQIGVSKRVVVIDVGDGLLELINPEIVSLCTQSEVQTEGCLSVPQIVGDVARHKKVVVRAIDRQGAKITVNGEDLLARALQHEIDHLDGVLFIDKADNLRPVPRQDD